MHLPGDDETVRREQLGGLRVAIGRGRVVQVDVLSEMVDPVAQQVHDAALGDLALQAGKELVTSRRRLGKRQCLRSVRLRLLDERGQVAEVERVGCVEVGCCALGPATFDHLVDDEFFKARFIEAVHCQLLSSAASGAQMRRTLSR